MMHRLDRMSVPSINSASGLSAGEAPLERFPWGNLGVFKRLAVARRLPEVMAITLLSRSRSTEQLHGVHAEIVGAILDGIDKCEASHEHDFVLVLGVRGEERIQVGPS